MKPRFWNPALETLGVVELKQLQLVRLRGLLARVAHTNPFYQDLFKRHGVDVAKINSIEAFAAVIPFIGKSDLLADQDRNPPYGSRMVAALNDLATVVTTSGTSGLGREVHVYTNADLERSVEQFSYMCRWQGIESGERFFHMTRVAMELGGTWYKRGAEKYNLTYFNVAAYDTEMRVDYMRRFSPHLIHTSTSYLNRLTTVLKGLNLAPQDAFPDLKVLSIGTEAHTVEWAQRMEAYWGVQLHERFGSTQSGGTHLFTCESGVQVAGRRGVMHNMDHKVLAEVLDPETGDHVAPGDEGELVVTNLYMEGFPAIRFRMSDKVRYLGTGSCECGRPFTGIETGSVGRLDDMIKMKTYSIWPNSVDAIVLEAPHVVEYAGRVFIGSDGRETIRVSVELEVDHGLSADEVGGLYGELAGRLKRQTGVTMEIENAAPGSLPRFEAKPRRWRDERLLGGPDGSR